MSLHLAISANDEFISNLLLLAEEDFLSKIGKITIVESSDAQLDNYDDLDILNQYDYEYKKFGQVDWQSVDLYLFYDYNIENLKFLSGTAALGILSLDCTGYSAVLDQMPVVVPRIDESEIELVKEKKFASLPHPQVSQLLYILHPLRRKEKMLYVSLSNTLPITYVNDKESAEELAKQSRDLLTGNNKDLSVYLAFDINHLNDVAPSKQLNLEAQIKRIIPEIDTIHVHNQLAPIFYGIYQSVTVGLTTGNIIDQGVAESWLKEVKEFDGVVYREEKSSPRKFVESYSTELLEFSNVVYTDNIKWTSITDNTQLVTKQIIELMNLFVKHDLLKYYE